MEKRGCDGWFSHWCEWLMNLRNLNRLAFPSHKKREQNLRLSDATNSIEQARQWRHSCPILYFSRTPYSTVQCTGAEENKIGKLLQNENKLGKFGRESSEWACFSRVERKKNVQFSYGNFPGSYPTSYPSRRSCLKKKTSISIVPFPSLEYSWRSHHIVVVVLFSGLDSTIYSHCSNELFRDWELFTFFQLSYQQRKLESCGVNKFI